MLDILSALFSVEQFPECTDESGVSISCLDLCYSVTIRTKKVKDEKKVYFMYDESVCCKLRIDKFDFFW